MPIDQNKVVNETPWTSVSLLTTRCHLPPRRDLHSSGSSLKPEQMAFKTASLSRGPLYLQLLRRRACGLHATFSTSASKYSSLCMRTQLEIESRSTPSSFSSRREHASPKVYIGSVPASGHS